MWIKEKGAKWNSENILTETAQIIMVFTEATIWIAQAWATSVAHYGEVSCVQTNTLTEIIVRPGFKKKKKSGWKASKSSKGRKNL